MKEEWKSVPGYVGWYEVSSLGRIKRLERTIMRTMVARSGCVVSFPQCVRGHVFRTLDERGRKYKPGVYPMVSLCKDGIIKKKYIHLVAKVFLGKKPAKAKHICHDDGNERNCAAKNLRYDTVKGNASDRYKHGTDAQGENNPSAILNETQVRKIKRALARGVSASSIAESFGRPRTTISSIKYGYTWAHVDI